MHTFCSIERTLKSDNEQRIDLLAKKVEETLGIKQKGNYSDLFLENLVRDYHYYALEAI